MGEAPRPTPGAHPADAERRWGMTSAVPATFQPISPASWHPNPGPPKPEATRANEEWAGEEGQAASLWGRRGPAARIQAAPGRARGCGAAPAGVGGRAGWQVSAASAFGGDGAAPGSCGRPLALAPRPPPAPAAAAAAGRRRPGPAGRTAAARAASAALGRAGRGELGAARRRARGPGPPCWPLAPRRARRGPGLRPCPGLRRQAGQQHAPGERAGPGSPPNGGAVPPPNPPARGPRRAPRSRCTLRGWREIPAAEGGGARGWRGSGWLRPAGLCVVTAEAIRDFHSPHSLLLLLKLSESSGHPRFPPAPTPNVEHRCYLPGSWRHNYPLSDCRRSWAAQRQRCALFWVGTFGVVRLASRNHPTAVVRSRLVFP